MKMYYINIQLLGFDQILPMHAHLLNFLVNMDG